MKLHGSELLRTPFVQKVQNLFSCYITLYNRLHLALFLHLAPYI